MSTSKINRIKEQLKIKYDFVQKNDKRLMPRFGTKAEMYKYLKNKYPQK